MMNQPLSSFSFHSVIYHFIFPFFGSSIFHSSISFIIDHSSISIQRFSHSGLRSTLSSKRIEKMEECKNGEIEE